MPLLNPLIEEYLNAAIPGRDPVVQDMEALAAERGFPIIGPLCGRLCHQQALLVGAKHIFEMGSGYGYSTYWFSSAVGPDGAVIHTDGSPDNSAKARDYLTRAGLADRVTFEVGDALDIIERYEGPFDIIFCDIDKEGYPEAFEKALPRLRAGGLLIFDNILWFGTVADERDQRESTVAIRTVTKMMYDHPDLMVTIVPLRDGMILARKA